MNRLSGGTLALGLVLAAGTTNGAAEKAPYTITAAAERGVIACVEIGSDAQSRSNALSAAAPQSERARLQRYLSLHAQIREESGVGEVIPGSAVRTRASDRSGEVGPPAHL